MVFDYDQNKNKANIKKHGVDFEEAISIFSDPFLAISKDDSQSKEEIFIALGCSKQGKTLFVVHCYRDKEEIIRIISARKLTKFEKECLEEV